MSLLLTLVLGGLAGWLASLIMARDGQMGVVLNIVVGVAGAFLANWVLAPLVGGAASVSTITLGGFLMSVLGAVVLLAIVNLVTRKSLR